MFTTVTFPSGVNTDTMNLKIKSISNVKLWNFTNDAFIGNVPFNSIINNSFNIDLSSFGLSFGEYYITFDAVSIYNQIFNLTDKNIYKFSIQNGHYNNTQYNNLQYFTD